MANLHVVGLAVQSNDIRSIVERVEVREKGRKELIGKISKLYLEAKGLGYDVKVLRAIIRLRKMQEGDRVAQEATFDTYKQALGMLV
jgi:uncharacterized protein (UPF0335 family)